MSILTDFTDWLGSLGGGGGTDVSGMPQSQALGLDDAWAKAKQLMENPPNLWQGPQVAPVSGETSASYGMGVDSANKLNLFGDMATNAFKDSTNMDIAGNPVYQNAASDITKRLNTQFNEDVVPGIAETYGAQGAFGGSDQQLAFGTGAGKLADATGTSLTNLATNIYGIQAGRSNAALASIPGVTLANTAGYNQLSQVGAAKDARAQSELTDTVNTFNANENAPEVALDRYMQRLRGQYTASNSQGGSAFGSAIQGGVGGAAVGSQTDVGAGWGGVLGMILGLLGQHP